MPTSETHVTTTLRCNNRCGFCPQQALDERPDIRVAVETGVERVVIQGGEPTLSTTLLDDIAALRASGVQQVLLQTNGRRLAYAEYVDGLVQAGLTHLDVSLHGHRPEVHDYHTSVPGSFKHTAKGLLNAGKSPLSVGVTTVLTRSNFRHMPALAKLLTKLRVDAWHITPARAFGPNQRRFSPRLGMVDEPVTTAIRLASRAGIAVGTSGLPHCIGGSIRHVLGAPRLAPSAPQCALCVGVATCEGAYDGYADSHAASDLNPIASAPPERPRPASLWFGGIGETSGDPS